MLRSDPSASGSHPKELGRALDLDGELLPLLGQTPPLLLPRELRRVHLPKKEGAERETGKAQKEKALSARQA